MNTQADIRQPNVPIRIAAIPNEFLDRVRRDGIDDLGQPVKRVIAEGGEPCRDVLRRAHPGEALILASFSPFTKAGPYREFGPIFVLAAAADESVRRDQLPTEGEQRFLRDQFAIRAYSDAEEIIDAAIVPASDAAAAIERLLGTDGTAFLHARFPAYGCFALRIDRA
jgi:hypothetical protein